MTSQSVYRILAALSLVVCSSAHAGPFGLSEGMQLEELRQLTDLKETKTRYSYRANQVPTPHDAFSFYMLNVTPKSGLCRVRAIGRNVTTSVYGNDLRSAFDSLKVALSDKYGSNKIYDFLRAGSIWDEPKDWMMALRKKERTLAAAWSEKHQSTLSDGVKAILLQANALESETGYVTVLYDFSNFAQCSVEFNAGRNKGL